MGTLNLSSGTITGLNAGGLPDGCVQAADLASGVGGKILQVVQTINSSMVSEAVADRVYEDISGMSVAITPSATSSKVLVFYRVAVATTSGAYNTLLRLVRGSTAICLGDDVGSNRPRATTVGWSAVSANQYHIIGAHNTMFLDSPSTTSSTTYKLQWTDSYGNTLYMNRTQSDGDHTWAATQVSHITVMEVAA